MNNQGTLLVVSGFSGAGKGTVIKELLKEHDNYSLSISATTRKPRAGADSMNMPSMLIIITELQEIMLRSR